MKIEALKRTFAYNAIDLADPGAALTPAAVKDFYTSVYPDLTNAEIEGPKVVGSTHAYTFRRAVGTKGAKPKADLVQRLRDEADLCMNETATDVAMLLYEAAQEIERLRATPETLMRKPAVMEATGLTHSMLYKEIREGRFPPPVKVSERVSAWARSDVTDFIAAAIARSRPKASTSKS